PPAGTPQSWQGRGPMQAPVVDLERTSEERWRQALGASLLYVAAVAFVCLIAYFPLVAAFIRHLVPEQLLGLALVGWLIFGASLVGVLLALLGVGLRVALLTLAAKRLWARRFLGAHALATQGGSTPAG